MPGLGCAEVKVQIQDKFYAMDGQTLRPGDIAVMDNLPAHKLATVRGALEQAGAQVFYLPRRFLALRL